MATRQLAEWGLEGLEDSTKLIVSELVTNAVHHSTGLFLIAQLARRWGARHVSGGKVVWAEADLATTSSHA
jgi:hypothetical protein